MSVYIAAQTTFWLLYSVFFSVLNLAFRGGASLDTFFRPLKTSGKKSSPKKRNIWSSYTAYCRLKKCTDERRSVNNGYIQTYCNTICNIQSRNVGRVGRRWREEKVATPPEHQDKHSLRKSFHVCQHSHPFSDPSRPTPETSDRFMQYMSPCSVLTAIIAHKPYTPLIPPLALEIPCSDMKSQKDIPATWKHNCMKRKERKISGEKQQQNHSHRKTSHSSEMLPIFEYILTSKFQLKLLWNKAVPDALISHPLAVKTIVWLIIQ